MSALLIPSLLLFDGMVCTMAALFAQDMSIDSNPGLGRIRLIMLFLGTFLIIISLSIFFSRKKKYSFLESIIISENAKTLFLLGHLWTIVFAIYAWFITYGNFTTWDHTTHYYTQLADAFGKGQVYIDLKPGKALETAIDPYNPTNRPPFRDEVWDMSLYKGKLYLYWGPLPALLITPIQMVSDVKVTDNYLVFFFSAGLLIFNSLICLKLWRKFYPNIPAKNMFVCVPLIGLVLPIVWVASTPNVYEAAISAGQFFLLGGIYFVVSALEQNSSVNRGRLFLGGIFWACSVGSRAINVFSVIFMASITSIWIVRNLAKPVHWSKYVQAVIPLFMPLIAGAMVIGWYNWTRFDSPLEFGLRFQITIQNLNKQINLVFQPVYILQNLYIYVFQPFLFVSRFPFIRPDTAFNIPAKFNIVMPEIYASGRTTGLLFAAPFLALGLVYLFSKKKIPETMNLSGNAHLYDQVIHLLAGTVLINLAGILSYFYGQMRFLVDVISPIALLSIIGYWRLISIKQASNSSQSKLMVLLANVLLVLTITASLLLAISSEKDRIETLNPFLWQRISDFLTIKR
jgi:hypothetical protein